MNVLPTEKNKLRKILRVLDENRRPSTSCDKPFLPQVLKKTQTLMLKHRSSYSRDRRIAGGKAGLRKPAGWDRQPWEGPDTGLASQ